MDKPRQRRSSGPRTFDRDEAVEIAMRLFRRYGYEGVSIADLTGAIGIAPPSLYAAFGSKAGLYREALDRYAALPGALEGMAGAETLEEAVSGLLEAAIRSVVTDERGCMISTGLVEGAPAQQDLARELRTRRQGLRGRIAAALRRWLSVEDADRLAAYLLAVQQGIAVQARDGADEAELLHIRDEVMIGVAVRHRSPAA
ncbi:TetR/AcrR family transcriptional regulator [Sphingomonas morindae]|uniref:TetR/AcrR family transcriptional regulator n=1 Tax=Sphingomonas morindae TaxID=1541170 RepID=A0ABY4XD79_9SPHN|nr:TetR/AcrR family transcriptional regulator [Sphingomonas morindae]USI74706.1 TetR/AcrR family transcriptional regulator [Sphingomonas morindae]